MGDQVAEGVVRVCVGDGPGGQRFKIDPSCRTRRPNPKRFCAARSWCSCSSMYAEPSASTACANRSAPAPSRKPGSKQAAPGYVRYQRPPVVEPLEPLVLESGERLQGEIKYYDYGVVSVVFELAFAGDGRGWSAWPAAGSGTSTSPHRPPPSSAAAWSAPPRAS